MNHNKGDIFSLVAVESPDDGGWYCEIYYHADDRKRAVLAVETGLKIWPTAIEALHEGRSIGRENTTPTDPFFESTNA